MTGRGNRRRATVRRVVASAVVAATGASLAPTPGTPAGASPPGCAPREAGGPMWITPDCVDPLYDRPVIDGEADLAAPVPHRRVTGHFAGTDVRFTIALPPRHQWDGRFFQLTYPFQTAEPSAETIGFGAASGAYTVQTGGGLGYRHDAAAAKFSESVAAEYYGTDRRISGYIYGASGGSYQTIGAVENSVGVWDGAVPMVMGTPTSIPNNFMARALARLVLRDEAERIAAAVAPGGTGDPYAGLDPVEQAALREATSMGVPLRGWEYAAYLLGLTDPAGLLGLGDHVRSLDPTYADDFWNVPGYLGTELSPVGDLVRAALVDHLATITRVDRDAAGTPTRLVLDGVPPDADPTGLDFTAYDADGTTALGAVSGSLDHSTRVFTVGGGNDAGVLAGVDVGDKLRIDNRWYVALHAYYRHQVPDDPSYHAWDQFRGHDGEPVNPQRPVEVGPMIAREPSGGGTHSGEINAKVIVVQNLLDTDAFPWHADWYRQRVDHALGPRAEDSFRLWYNDNADHNPGPVDGARLVPYTGIYQQALRDVAAWAEDGVAPPRSTRYEVADGQVQVPDRAGQRGGIQPVVDLSVDGADLIEVGAGQPVTFTAMVQAPPRAGSIVAAEWDLAGTGTFSAAPVAPTRSTVRLETTFTYTTPGTYYPVVRATVQRDGDTDTPFARVQNLGRVRVVVR